MAATTPDLTVSEVEAALVTMESDAGIEETVKEVLRPKYKQAIQALKDAADNAARAASYREAIGKAPKTTATLHAQLEALPSAEESAKVTPTGSTQQLQKDVDARRAAFSELNGNLSKATIELARVKERPLQVSARLPEAQRELSELRSQLMLPEFGKDATSPGRIADRFLLRAGAQKLLSELEMLKQEQLSQSVREELLQTEFKLLTRRVENATATLEALDSQLDEGMQREVKRVGMLAETTPRDVSETDESTKALAAKVQALAREFEDVVKGSKHVSAAQDDVSAQRESLIREYESIREQLKLGSVGRAMAQVLLDLRRRLLNAAQLATRVPTLDDTRLAAIQVEAKIREQPELESQFARRSSDPVVRLLDARLEVLKKLRTQYGNLIRALAMLDGEKAQHFDKAQEVHAYISEQLFWMRSSAPIGGQTLTGIPSGLRWTLQPQNWLELREALQTAIPRFRLMGAGIVLAAGALLLTRRRIVRALERTAEKTRRISTDRYAHTGEALFWTLLLAIPLPLLLGAFASTLGQAAEPSAWLRGFTVGLRIATWVAFVVGFIGAVCRPGGLGAVHFGWPTEPSMRFRRALYRFAVLYIPALIVTCCTLYGDSSRHLDSVGRVSFILAHVWTAIILWQLLRFSDGVFANMIRAHPRHLLARWRYVWYPLALACPLSLVALAALGYVITAIQLSLELLATEALIAGGVILYWLTLRWFMINQRKLALNEALEQRRTQQQAKASQDQEEDSGEVVTVDADDEMELDLDSIGEQTRHLLRSLFTLAVLLAIVLLWSGAIPFAAVVAPIRIPMAGGLTIVGLVQVALILIVTYIVVQDLPGVLELAFLRATTIAAGTRYAIARLCQYGAIAIGLGLLFSVLRIDWAQFGWIAAALGVGIGFGLQEVVANFVCGLVLLFERPIRVGDVVTVEETTGTVTRICMRSTTIINWDRQELVVPNKNLITSTILNWTLSAPINRLIIPVGVAYGTDTEKARQILLQVALDHPHVVDDPPPMATFEEFADSSLTLHLLAYIPNVENRRQTITDLHSEIDKRFAAAGVEIAFPQRDLHLRSGWKEASQGKVQGAEPGNEDMTLGEPSQVS